MIDAVIGDEPGNEGWHGPLGPAEPHDGWGPLAVYNSRWAQAAAVLPEEVGQNGASAAATGPSGDGIALLDEPVESSPHHQWGAISYVGPRRKRPDSPAKTATASPANDASPAADASSTNDASSADAGEQVAAGQQAVAPEGQPAEVAVQAGAPAAETAAQDVAASPAGNGAPDYAQHARSNAPSTSAHDGRSDAPSTSAQDRAEDGAAAAESNRGLMTSSRTMAVASLASRLTGFLRTVALAAALGIAASKVADSYNLANILPNMVYELLLGGVLSSVVIPLIVHSQEHDDDGGEAYTQRLLSWATVVLAVATLLAVAAAPLLAAAFASQHAQRELISIFATLLLPEIFFYGLGAMFTAVLNTRGVYGPPAWAPVLNNLITLATVGAFTLLPGPATLNESTITNTQILVLGIGTTAGIAVQALVLTPYLRKVGFRWRWRFRPSGRETVRMGEVRTLALWVLGYVAISQVGVYVINKVANRHTGGPTTFAYGDLLFQVPYGIVGVSLLTALMPRMSRSAARGDNAAVIADLSLGSRLSAVGLLPVTGALMVLGPSLAVVLFAYGRSGTTDGRNVGVVLALSAFGLLPFALVMLQLRVFYALRDARTPTLINAFMVATKVALVLVFNAVLTGERVILWLGFATSTSYLVGAVAGYFLLARRFGGLGFRAVGATVARMVVVTAVASAAALAVVLVVQRALGHGPSGSLLALLGAVVAGVIVLIVMTRIVKVAEIDQLVATVRGR